MLLEVCLKKKKKTTYTALVILAKPMATNIIQKKTQIIGVPDFENTIYHSAVILRSSTLLVKDTFEISNFQF